MERVIKYKMTLTDEVAPGFDRLQKTIAGGVAAVGVSLAGLGVALAAGFAGALKSATELGGKLSDMSARTGVSVEGLQKLGFAAKLSGTSMEAVAGAVNKMQKGIVDGGKGFAQLGLDVGKLRAMAPEKAFAQVGDAIAKLKSPTEQAAAAMAVFGRGGTEVLAMLKSGLASTMEEAEKLGLVMSKRTAAAADALGDSVTKLSMTWEGLKHNLVSVVIENASLHAFINKGVEILGNWSKKIGESRVSLADLVSNGVILFAQSLVSMADAGQQAMNWFDSLMVILRGTKTAFLELQAAGIKYSIWAASQGGKITETLTFGAFGQRDLIPQYQADLKKVQDELIATGKAANESDERSVKWGDTLSKLRGGLVEMQKAAEGAKGKVLDFGKSAGGPGADGVNKLAEAVDKLKIGGRKDALLTGTPMLLQPNFGADILKAGMKGLTSDMKADLLSGMPQVLKHVEQVKKTTIDWRQALQDAANQFRILGGTAGAVLSQIGGAVASVGTGIQNWQTASKAGGIGGLFGKLSAGAGIAGAAMGVVSFIGGLFGRGKAKREEERREREALLKETSAKLDELSKRIDQIKMDKLMAGVTGLASLFKNAADSADLTQERMDRLGLFGAAMFEELKRQGLSTVEAFHAMGPALDEAIAAAEKHGLTITGTLGVLADFRTKVGANEGLVSAAEGVGKVIDALRTTGNLTKETFAGVQAETSKLFDELIAKGFTSQQALALLAPALMQIRDAARDGKLSIDEGTQALITQADTAGLFEGLKDPMDELVEVQKLMLEAVAALTKAFGGDLPESVQKYIDKLKQIPSVPGPPGSEGGASPQPPKGDDLPGAQYGASGLFHPSLPHGPLPDGGTLFVGHPGEGVLFRPGGFGSGNTGVTGGGGFVVNLAVSVASGDPQAIANKLDDELRDGGRLKRRIQEIAQAAQG